MTGSAFRLSLSSDTCGALPSWLIFIVNRLAASSMDECRHAMWQVVSEPEEVADAFTTALPWSAGAQNFAGQG